MHKLTNLLRRKRDRMEQDLDREMQYHLDRRVKDFMDSGLSEQEAHRRASMEFGGVANVKEEVRETWFSRTLADLAGDIRYAVRVLRRSPGFTLVAVVSIALGIGANTIVFSVLNSLLLRPIPIAEPERVYFLNNSGEPANSYPNYRDIRDRNSVFSSLFLYRLTYMALDNGSGAQRIWGFLVTGNYFESLGIQPFLGRFFGPSEDVTRNAHPYAVLSYSCWEARFGADPEIAGKVVRLNGHPYTVLGVAPKRFHGTEVPLRAEIWVPLSMQVQIEGRLWLDERNSFNGWIAGRLKPGVSFEQAEANLQIVGAQLAREHTVNENMRLSLTPMGLVGSTGRAPARAYLLGVMILAVLVLLAACANLASLLAARTGDRFRELAIRVSIGASRGRIVRQLLTESLVISLAGGAAGWVVAVMLLRALSQWRAPMDFPVQFDVSADWRVFIFACAAALLTGLLFGSGPARQAWKTDPALGIKGMHAAASGRRLAPRDILLLVQAALCCLLVTASLVATRGLIRSIQTPLAFKPDGAAVITFDSGLAGYNRGQSRAFSQRALEAVSQLPGVESAAYANSVPLSIDQSWTTVYPENTADFRPKNAYQPCYYYVSPGYFRTAGTVMLAGREFTPQDDPNSPQVAIVNQTFAKRVLGTTDAVGRRFRRGRNDLVEVVGLVEDGKYTTLTEAPKAAIFLPARRFHGSESVLLVRTRLRETEMAAEMRRAIERLDPRVPVFGVGSLRQMLGLVYLPMHAAAIALGAFGVLALMLSVTGVYGVAAYGVSRRAREIGIRIAVGAGRSEILKFVLGRTGALVATGALVGLAAGIAAARMLTSIVYEANSRDPIVIAATLLTIAIAGVAAAFGPARRALRVDPVQALRSE